MVDNILTSLGGGSGIDTKALVESLVAAERAPRETILDSKTKTLETQISGYGALRSTMTGIQDSMKLLADADTFNARNVSFADTRLVTPTSVDPGAAVGSYSINVSTLASAHSLSAGGFSDANAVVGNGTLTFSFGDWDAGFTTLDATGTTKASKTLTIDESNNTLNGIRDAINAANFGVQASVIETNGSYAIQLTSESGASNEMKIVVSEGSPAGLAALQFDESSQTMTQNAQGIDANFKLNGLDITRSSNSIDDVINGLEFTLNGVSADANDNMSVSVEADKGYGEQIVRDFVEAYNLFLEQTSKLITPTEVDEDAEDQTLGVLSRDPTTKSMINQVRALISSNITGLGGNYTALATVGIQTQISGELEINEDLFKDALDNHFNDLTSIFAGTSSTSDARLGIVKTNPTTQAGTYEVVVTTDPAKGYAAGGSISVTDAADLGLNTATGVFAGGLDTSAGSYSFQVKVDGTTSNLITLNGNYADTDALIADLQAQINGDSFLSAVGAAVDISYDTATGSFTTTSRSWGGASTIAFSNISADMDRFALGGGATAAGLTSGAITEPMSETSGILVGGSIDETGVADLGGTQGSLTTTGSINGAAATNLVDGAPGADTYSINLDLSGGGYTFDLLVDGAETASVNLLGSYADTDALVADMQAQINGTITGGAAVTVSYDSTNDKFSFTSATLGSGSTVAVSAAGANIGELGISVESGTTGVDNETFVSPLNTGVGDYSMTVNVDGTDVAIDLATIDVGNGLGIFNTTEEVRGALDSAITGASVSYDSGSNSYTITSDSTGTSSTIEITAVGTEMTALGFSVAAGTAGEVDNFTTPLNTGVGAYSFTIDVDGGGPILIDLATIDVGHGVGIYNSAEEVRSALDSAIAGVTVGYDATSDSFSFTSASTGSASSLAIAAVGADIGTKLGITGDSDTGRDALAATSGVDVVGTIDGVAAFGSGNILLPELGSKLAGLSLEVAPGVTTATITIAQGFGNEVNNILDTFLKNNGLIATRETRMNTELTDIETDRKNLDRQMEARQAMLQSQFLAMEAIIRSLNATSSSLDGLVDRLPFTAKK